MAEVVGSPRARIGLIIPASNRLTEEDFHRYAPEGVHPHVTRLRMTGAQRVPVLELLPRITEAAEALADARCDIIVFHCTASSMEAGLEAERLVIQTIERATGVRGTSTASALVEGCRALGVRRLVLISPYAPEANRHEMDFLGQAGLEVVRDRALDLPGSDAYVAAAPDFWVRVAQEEADERADAYLLSCSNIRSIGVIEEIEPRLARPVLTSNQATLWYCLRACGRSDAVAGLGQLFRLQLPAKIPA